MVNDDKTGYGHDLTGWEFYKSTKVAYGTVIINGRRYESPVPIAMYWRPDRMICEYLVGGVTIREEKFIALNDTACSIITVGVYLSLLSSLVRVFMTARANGEHYGYLHLR